MYCMLSVSLYAVNLRGTAGENDMMNLNAHVD